MIYTGDTDCSPEDIRGNAKKKFNIELPPQVEFIYMHRRKWLESTKYPIFSMVGQTLGSIYVGFEALFKFVPGMLTSCSFHSVVELLFSSQLPCNCVQMCSLTQWATHSHCRCLNTWAIARLDATSIVRICSLNLTVLGTTEQMEADP